MLKLSKGYKMIRGFWGKKIGMTQIFVKDKVVPVTAIDTSNWLVTAVKTEERDGYSAVQIACVKKRYASEQFTLNWLKKLTTYFSLIKEVRVDGAVSCQVGKAPAWNQEIKEFDLVDVTGVSKGCGFAGVVRRHGFRGPRASHGGKSMGKRPGSIGFMTSQGRVIKGKKLPGRMGGKRSHVSNLEVVQIKSEEHVLLVKGAVPGKAGSFVFVHKS